jgi:hypothetical protein
MITTPSAALASVLAPVLASDPHEVFVAGYRQRHRQVRLLLA